jgi:hypothetical protein
VPKRPLDSGRTAANPQPSCRPSREGDKQTDILHKRAELASKAYGAALFEIYYGFKFHEEDGLIPTLESVRKYPDLYDGGVAGIDVVEELINAYLCMRQAERDEIAGRVIDNERLDKLIAAFDDWIES